MEIIMQILQRLQIKKNQLTRYWSHVDILPTHVTLSKGPLIILYYP